ncbi:hypothetical protein [Actinoplanes sp. NPDC051494]|uniref:hypothetical protein n=1 Tax=Actinoplanes sp. NPDC051494 TaxID=3363907 RepID=UPI0037B53B46
MEQEHVPGTGNTLADLVAGAGIVVTPEGLARAKVKIDAARARLTPEVYDRMRAQIGLPPRSADA